MIYKNTLIKIKRSLGRYLSLFIIVLIGVGFYSGITSTSPDIIASADQYNKEHKLMDMKIISAMGLTKKDVTALKGLDHIQSVIPSYSLDVLANGKAIKVHALENSLNTVSIIKGRMPQTNTECLADSNNYRIGDKITITSNVSGQLKNKEYTVVGTVDSPLYQLKDYGSTSIGDGKLSSFLFVKKENFILKAYTEIYLTLTKPKDIASYSDAYETILSKAKEEIKGISEQRKDAPWYVYDRDAVIGYNDLKLATDMIISVSKVLPLFFILIVMLMTANTMARMIVEERSELGTLTSLGYRNTSIISSYLFYVLSATVFGAISGFLIGSYVIPRIIYSTFDKFILPDLIIHYDIRNLAIILAIAISLMAGVTIFFAHMELKQDPSTLMRPVPPRKGQTILLEKIGIIWRHLSFTWKVTLRNIFRYKQRVLMTIVGVAGCTALLLTGFGLRDSINGVAEKQYGEIFRYHAIAILKNETNKMSNDLKSLFAKEKVEAPVLIKQASFHASTKNKTMDSYLIVPDDTDVFQKYFDLRNKKSGTSISLMNQGVVITGKLSDVLQIEKGDTIKLKDSNDNTYSVKVASVTENYMKNYIYMSKDMYRDVFQKNVSFNMAVFDYSQNKDTLAKHLINSKHIVNVTYQDDILQKAIDGNKSLNNVIVLIVVVASMLVIIVLYNLTSINISERTREIATLKVLGFTDKESNQYIYREAFILTLLSTGIGLVLGIYLHGFVIGVIEGNESSYFRSIHGMSFVWSALIIIVVSFIMQMVTYLKMQKIDMIESLKSVE
ncbi:ABC transporter permease [Anaeromicropila herbilytica]|uniref:ABC3 transporter permease C-terminal domain-containing protein n=1 Tax=Anaeromicropila herbilytica TaxID=2785025 RepID=A0A7R7EL38_9FIRM|nr:hypothetical protein bsdtb5_20690 [Anaeromicropila herbilytica]